MKKCLLILAFCTFAAAARACPACEKKQPKILRNLAHNAGPESNWDYWILCGMVLITLYVLVISIKYLVRPGEAGPGHIKRSILEN